MLNIASLLFFAWCWILERLKRGLDDGDYSIDRDHNEESQNTPDHMALSLRSLILIVSSGYEFNHSDNKIGESEYKKEP